jgi:hypothetical protein
VRGQVGCCCADERTVIEHRCEVPLERAERPKHSWVPQADIDGAEPSGADPLESAPACSRDRCEVPVDPRHDVVNEVVLPDAGPFAQVGVDRRAATGITAMNGAPPEAIKRSATSGRRMASKMDDGEPRIPCSKYTTG